MPSANPQVPSDRTIRQSEDLLPHHLKINKVGRKKEGQNAPPKVTNSGLLLTIGQQAMQKLVDNAFQKLEIKNEEELPPYRESLSDKSRWAIPNLLNNVTEAGFYNMVVNLAAGHREDLIRPQPNGDWQPVGFRFVEVMDDAQNIPYLHLVIRWMDLKNAEEIKYHAGAPVTSPTVNVHNDNGSFRQLADAIQNKDSSNEKLMDMLAKLLLERGVAESSHPEPTKTEPPTATKTGKKKKLPPGV